MSERNRGIGQMSEQFASEVEQRVEKVLDTVMTHKLFLDTMSALLNINSFRRLAVRQTLTKVWKNLELPNKHDQEKTLYLVNELQFKIKSLERELAQMRAPSEQEVTSVSDPVIQVNVRPGKRKVTAGNSAPVQ